MRLFFILFLSVFFAGKFHAQSYTYKYKEEGFSAAFSNIIELFEEENYHEAIKEINIFIAYFEDNKIMYFNRGIANLRLNNFEAAKSDFIMAKKLGYESESDFLDMMTSEDELVKKIAEGYINNANLKAANGYKIEYTLKDSLQGSLRPERDCFDVYYYKLTVKVIPKSKSIEGENEIFFKVNQATNRIQIDLFDNLKVESIYFGEVELKYNRIHNAIFIDFDETLESGEKHSISVKYSGVPLVAPRPPWNGGFVWSKNKGKHWVGVACEHMGASSWWPNKDHLSDKVDSMTINLQVPVNYQGISNGNLLSTKKIDKDYVNFEWFVSYPINNYNVTFYMGDFVNFNEVFTNKSNSYNIDYYVLPDNIKIAKTYYEQTKDILEVFEGLYGEYPFARDGMAMIEAPYSGMEHQSAIAIGDHYEKDDHRGLKCSNYDYLVVHESAHEWWGNAIAVGDMADIWISEGFATYSEHLFVERKHGYKNYIETIGQSMQQINNIWPMVGNRDVNDNAFLGGDVYHKGATLLNNLRSIINDDILFFNILKGFYTEQKYKITTTQDFIDFVHSSTNKDYSSFFNKFLYDKTPPTLEYSFNIVDNTLSFYYRWINVDKEFEMPFCIVVDDSLCVRMEGTSEYQNFRKDNVNSFFLANEHRYKKLSIPQNSFTYYQTKWNSDKIVKTKDSKSYGILVNDIRQGEWNYYDSNGLSIGKDFYLDGVLHGLSEKYFPDDKLSISEHYRNGIKEGDYRAKYNNQLLVSGQYKNDKKDGSWINYHYDEKKPIKKKRKMIKRNPEMESFGNYKNGLKDGEWQYFTKENKLMAKEVYLNGKSTECEFLDSTATLILKIDTLSQVNSGARYRYHDQLLMKYIKKHFKSDQKLDEDDKSGLTVLSFLIHPNGTTSNFEIMKTSSKTNANKLIETIKGIDDWIPGSKNNIPVYSRMYLPYNISLK